MNTYAVCMSICAYVSDGSQQGDRRPVHAGVENQAHISKPKTHWAAAGGLTEKQYRFSNWRLMCNRPLCRGMAKAREHRAEYKTLQQLQILGQAHLLSGYGNSRKKVLEYCRP